MSEKKTPILDSVRQGGHRGPCTATEQCPGMRAAIAAKGRTGIRGVQSFNRKTEDFFVATFYELGGKETLAINCCPWCHVKYEAGAVPKAEAKAPPTDVPEIVRVVAASEPGLWTQVEVDVSSRSVDLECHAGGDYEGMCLEPTAARRVAAALVAGADYLDALEPADAPV